MNFNSWKRDKSRIANDLYKIRHWSFVLGDYHSLYNKKATWFIDPPYQFGGHPYQHNNKKIDFANLKTWCISRKGQIIICENTKATWMNFKPLAIHKTKNGTQKEAIWSNEITAFDNQQLQLL